jgi:hypothetical protein
LLATFNSTVESSMVRSPPVVEDAGAELRRVPGHHHPAQDEVGGRVVDAAPVDGTGPAGDREILEDHLADDVDRDHRTGASAVDDGPAGAEQRQRPGDGDGLGTGAGEGDLVVPGGIVDRRLQALGGAVDRYRTGRHGRGSGQDEGRRQHHQRHGPPYDAPRRASQISPDNHDPAPCDS